MIINKEKVNYYIVFYEKYSDLENMAPIVNYMLDKDLNSKVEFFYYGHRINEFSMYIIDWFQKKYLNRIIHNSLGYNKISNFKNKNNLKIKILNKTLSLGKSFSVSKDYYMNYYSNIMYSHLNQLTTLNDNLKNVICLYAFSGRDILTKTAIKTKNNKNIKWIRLPQGVKLTTSCFRDNTDKPFNAEKYADKWADIVIDTDNYNFDYLDDFNKKIGRKQGDYSGIVKLGAPRFSNTWIEILDNEIFNDYKSTFLLNDNKIKVLFLLTPWKKNVWKDETHKVIELILSYNVNLIVKGFHHDTLLDKCLENRIIRDEDSATTTLIRDADAVIYIATSVALESYIRGKETLNISYLHANQTILNTETSCIEAKSRDDMHVFMTNLINNGTFSNDVETKQKTEKFILENIVKNDVDLAYPNFILNNI